MACAEVNATKLPFEGSPFKLRMVAANSFGKTWQIA